MLFADIPADDDEIVRRIGDAEIVYTNKTPISKKVIDACPSMKMISMLATGYNVVDYVYAKEKGIPVIFTEVNGSDATAQMQAKFGRAKNLGERSIGAIDAGSASMATIFEAFA